MKKDTLILENITKTYCNGTKHHRPVLKPVSLEFKTPSWTYIIGGNGSGKTTLLKIISGDIFPDSGNVLLNGIRVNKRSLYQRAHSFYYIEQDTGKNLVSSMTIFENLILSLNTNVSFIPNFRLFRRKKVRQKIKNALKIFSLGLEDRLDTQVRLLSGGERQAIVAAKIMFVQPRFLLLDEFTSALDQKVAPMILKFLKSYSSEHGIAVILVTHDYSIIEETGDRVILLEDGQVKRDYNSEHYKLTEHFILDEFHERNTTDNQ
jgi:putative ABC transport system ATP-binding protein